MAAASAKAALPGRVAAAMRAGGFMDAVAAGGSSLERVREFLRAMEAAAAPAEGARQRPAFPLFPGLDHHPYHATGENPGVASLEAAAGTIRDECLALGESELLHYMPGPMQRTWSVYLFAYMGVALEPSTGRCPETWRALQALPRACLDYPWGDALFSVHSAAAHLRPHCSVDNLRLRCHLGLRVPPGCEIRVDTERRTWHEGRALLFEDSFEHEVWNRSDERRAVLIVDFWHPGLTDAEIAALTAGFRKSEVRRLFMMDRLAFIEGGVPASIAARLEADLASADRDPALRPYWR